MPFGNLVPHSCGLLRAAGFVLGSAGGLPVAPHPWKSQYLSVRKGKLSLLQDPNLLSTPNALTLWENINISTSSHYLFFPPKLHFFFTILI